MSRYDTLRAKQAKQNCTMLGHSTVSQGRGMRIMTRPAATNTIGTGIQSGLLPRSNGIAGAIKPWIERKLYCEESDYSLEQWKDLHGRYKPLAAPTSVGMRSPESGSIPDVVPRYFSYRINFSFSVRLYHLVVPKSHKVLAPCADMGEQNQRFMLLRPAPSHSGSSASRRSLY